MEQTKKLPLSWADEQDGRKPGAWRLSVEKEL
jgi:hypothetical protein